MMFILSPKLIVEIIYLAGLTAMAMPPGTGATVAGLALLICFLPFVVRYRMVFGYQDKSRKEWDQWRP